MSLLHTYIALLIRPRYLSHLMEPKTQTGAADLLMEQHTSLLQHQTSLDDVDQPSSVLLDTETRWMLNYSIDIISYLY